MAEKVIGEVKNMEYEIKQVEWRIPDFFAVTENQNYSGLVSPFFSIANNSWQLKLYPEECLARGDIKIYLKSSLKLNYSMEFFLGLENCDGGMEQLVCGILEKDDLWSYNIRLIKRAELLQRRSELVPRDVLTIICSLKLMPDVCDCSQCTILDPTKSLKLTKLETLSKNLKNLSTDKESCDITLHLKDKEYKAHKAVLIARSSVFAAMFQHNTSEKQTGIVNIPDCDPESFKMFLEFLYSGKLEELTPDNAIPLYATAEKYNVQELKTFCSELLTGNLTVENLCEVATVADKYDDAKLLAAVQYFFNSNLNQVLVSSEWDYLLKNDHQLANKLLVEMSKKMKAVD